METIADMTIEDVKQSSVAEVPTVLMVLTDYVKSAISTGMPPKRAALEIAKVVLTNFKDARVQERIDKYNANYRDIDSNIWGDAKTKTAIQTNLKELSSRRKKHWQLSEFRNVDVKELAELLADASLEFEKLDLDDTMILEEESRAISAPFWISSRLRYIDSCFNNKLFGGMIRASINQDEKERDSLTAQEIETIYQLTRRDLKVNFCDERLLLGLLDWVQGNLIDVYDSETCEIILEKLNETMSSDGLIELITAQRDAMKRAIEIDEMKKRGILTTVDENVVTTNSDNSVIVSDSEVPVIYYPDKGYFGSLDFGFSADNIINDDIGEAPFTLDTPEFVVLLETVLKSLQKLQTEGIGKEIVGFDNYVQDAIEFIKREIGVDFGLEVTSESVNGLSPIQEFIEKQASAVITLSDEDHDMVEYMMDMYWNDRDTIRTAEDLLKNIISRDLIVQDEEVEDMFIQEPKSTLMDIVDIDDKVSDLDFMTVDELVEASATLLPDGNRRPLRLEENHFLDIEDFFEHGNVKTLDEISDELKGISMKSSDLVTEAKEAKKEFEDMIIPTYSGEAVQNNFEAVDSLLPNDMANVNSLIDAEEAKEHESEVIPMHVDPVELEFPTVFIPKFIFTVPQEHDPEIEESVSHGDRSWIETDIPHRVVNGEAPKIFKVLSSSGLLPREPVKVKSMSM